MSADIRSISDSGRLDAAVARVVQDAQRGRVRPGEALNLGELAERLRVRPAQLRHGLEGLRRSDLFDVRQDVLGSYGPGSTSCWVWRPTSSLALPIGSLSTRSLNFSVS